MTDGDAAYGLLLRELDGWYVRSLIRSGKRWECTIGRTQGRAIEAAAAANAGLALRAAWLRVELRVGREP